MQNKFEIINYIIEKYNLKSYVEIGVENPYNNFLYIDCEKKYSVDPYFNRDGEPIQVNDEFLKFITHRMTSDDFFASLNESDKFDFIFIDGMHEAKQAAKDVLNGMKHLNEGGFIMMHDCLPPNEKFQMVPCIDENDFWNGDVWKVLPTINQMQPIEYNTINTDWGLGFLPYQELTINIDDFNPTLTWYDYSHNIVDIMHPISVHDFLYKY